MLAPSSRYHQKQGRQHKKIADWARQMIMLLRRRLPHRPLVLVGDNGCAVLDLLHRCQSLREPGTLIARLRQDAALSLWGSWNSLRQCLREWLYDYSDRARPCRTELDVSLCFAPLLKWVLSWWRGNPLALVVDPTLKRDDTAAIVISVLYPESTKRLRHSRGLAHPARQTTGSLDGSDSGAAASPGARGD